ncbi:histidine phosphatase family protein [Erythrobacter sp. HA6-11]
MRLILVRHGQPDTAATGTAGNPPLSAAGREQSQRVCDYLSHEHIDLVIHSGLDRAHHTARPLIKRSGTSVRVIAELGEVDRYGGQYGNIETIRSKGEAEWQRFLADPIGYFGIDGDRFVAETLDGYRSIFAEYDRQTIAIFTHGFPINILLTHALGLEGIANFVPDYCSITRVTGSDLDRLTVVSVNETAHLAPLRQEAAE